ncbi:MAG TPA: hypothetical protein VJZ26_01620 [Blastocatellia bacterium]|nr:hypothetical protein [Blastocatellia bacterium]
MGRTLTLELSEEVYEPLAKSAEQVGKTPEQMVVQILTESIRQFEDDPIEKFIGAFDSGITDLGTRHHEYIGQSLADELRGDDGAER